MPASSRSRARTGPFRVRASSAEDFEVSALMVQNVCHIIQRHTFCHLWLQRSTKVNDVRRLAVFLSPVASRASRAAQQRPPGPHADYVSDFNPLVWHVSFLLRRFGHNDRAPKEGYKRIIDGPVTRPAAPRTPPPPRHTARVSGPRNQSPSGKRRDGLFRVGQRVSAGTRRCGLAGLCSRNPRFRSLGEGALCLLATGLVRR